MTSKPKSTGKQGSNGGRAGHGPKNAEPVIARATTRLPVGADELLVALATPSTKPKGAMGIPAFLWGGPGQSKTSFVESLGTAQLLVRVIVVALHEPSDFGWPHLNNGWMSFACPDWVRDLEEAHDAILMLDELTLADPSKQAPCLRIVHERVVGQRPLPPHVRLVAAANRPESIEGGWPISPPLLNRFVEISWDFPPDRFADALTQGFVRPSLPTVPPDAHEAALAHWRVLLSTFLRFEPALLNTQPVESEFAFASPRSWDLALSLLAACDTLGHSTGGTHRRMGSVASNLLSGCVGTPASLAFRDWLKNQQVNPDEILAGKATLDIGKLRDDELMTTFANLGKALLTQIEREDGSRVVDAGAIYLTLIEQVAADQRLDTVFCGLREVLKSQMLPKLLVRARRFGRFDEVCRLQAKVFNLPVFEQFESAVRQIRERHTEEMEF